MPPSPFLLLSLLSILPTLALSEALQPFVLPSPSPSTSSSVPVSTIPAFPEQSDVASTCPLHLPPDLFPAVSRACSSPSPSRLRLRCCPSLAAWLLSSYAPAALSLRHVYPSSSVSTSAAAAAAAAADLPILPDDSESCIDSAVKTLRSNGVPLPPLNDSCDIPYCFCGIRLRPLSCPGPLSVSLHHGRWVPLDSASRNLQRRCSRSTLPGCSRCLHTLHQVKVAAWNGTKRDERSREERNGRERDCELMGLTWLLAANRTRYLPTATKVLRAYMATPEGMEPTTCSVRKGMPMAVDSAELGGNRASSARPLSSGDRGRRMAIAVLLVLVLVV